MTPSLLAPRRPATSDEPSSLARAPIGWRRRVVAIDDVARDELEREGLMPGAVVVVTARTPLGGPVVVELGRARLALSASIARRVATEPWTDPIGTPFPAAETD
ncbi:MAG TPA: FeoA family protein [Candidatus Limnocylindrales bacterium]|jgi:Fe2+ transport system protein FeoA